MFHIIERPPFDDFTFKLFLDLFKNRKSYGLQHAEFIYTWSAYMSLDNGVVKPKGMFEPGSIRTVPQDLTELYFWKYGYNHILGEGTFMNQMDDLYEHFKADMKDHPGFDSYTYLQFCRGYQAIRNNIQSKKQIEYKIHEIIKGTNIAVLFVKDHFRVNLEKSWLNPMPELSEYFANMCDYYRDKKFVLVTSLENLHKEIDKPNCTVIPMGGDITNQIFRFSEYMPVERKVKTDKTSISLNRGVRNHRTYLVALLYGLGLDQHIDISYLGLKEISKQNLLDVLKYNSLSDPYLSTVSEGFKKFMSTDMDFDDVDIYKETKSNDNIYNFNNSLRNKYRSSFVEFISETNYNELSFNVTEKFSHSVFGYNIPIVVSSPGYVEFLRTAGFDVFDDLVDHTYDTTPDKIKRLHTLVNSNADLVSSGFSEKIFNKHKSRFDFNCNRIVNDFPAFYHDRFWKKLKDIKT